MLIQFRVQNHRSLKEEQTLSLVGHDHGGAHRIVTPALDEALLPAAAIYGANASGKTNVLLGLSFMKTAVLLSHRIWEPDSGVPQEGFALASAHAEPSLYEVQIVVDGVRYRYGFLISAERVLEEWLFAWPKGRKQTWFHREDEAYDFGRHLHGENEVIRGLTRANSLFLSAAAQNNHPMLMPVFGWFRSLRFEFRRSPWSFGSYSYAAEDHPFFATRMFEQMFSRQTSLFPEDDPFQSDREAIVELLQAADTGIVDVRVERGEERARGARRARILFQHRADDSDSAWLPLEVQSAGTITLLELAVRLIPALRTGSVLCVDEIEASLHPMLAAALLRLFCDKSRNPNGAQLIFTTHDTNLLGTLAGDVQLGRDQVWFTEKDSSGASHLYPLTDFHPRKEENLERGYLQGRYGAVPFLGEFSFDAHGRD